MTPDKSKLGLVHIYTGEGKGKTSAGMGLIIRALGRGLKVKIIQLFKRDTGEQFFFENSGIKYLQFKPLHPYFKNYDESELESLKKDFLEFWNNALRDIEEYDIILIDEVGPGLNWKVIPEDLIFELIENSFVVNAVCNGILFRRKLIRAGGCIARSDAERGSPASSDASKDGCI